MVILAADDRIMVRADSGGAELALPHFRKYGVFDDVSIDDVSSSTFELHLFGPEAIELARRAAGSLPEDFEFAHIVAEIEGDRVRLVRESPALPRGVTVIGELAAAASVKERLLEHGGISALSRSTLTASMFCVSRRGRRSLVKKLPIRICRRNLVATTEQSISSRAAIWVRRRSRASMRSGMLTRC